MIRPLGELLSDADVAATLRRVDAGADIDAVAVTGIEYDSRRVVPGSLFCCIPGGVADGHDFAASAVASGATALLVARPLPLAVPQLLADVPRAAMAHLASAFWGHPSRSLRLVGVTGTNGKTTTSSLLAAVLESAGVPSGLIGTLSGPHTTPEAPDLQRLLADHVAAGRRAVVMEVSSHALVMHRVDGCRFELAVFTNLGRDHLDLHGTLDAYFAAKASLFTPSLSRRGLANRDDEHGRILADSAPIAMNGFSMADIADVEIGPTWHRYTWRGQPVQVGIGGRFNVMNSLAAASAAALLGVEPASVAEGLSTAPPVRGRFEPIHAGQAFDVVVDYAHTPDGLASVLASLREGMVGRPDARLHVVFGCGGDRDREKRPEMGEVAARAADHVLVTSDNPRSEDPLQIIDAIVGGVPREYLHRVVTQPDRRRAIADALRSAGVGDVVLIAGKGHESTQTVGAEVLPFDDAAVARAVLGGAS